MFYNVKLKLPFDLPFSSWEAFNAITLQDDIDYGHDIDESYISEEAVNFFNSKGMLICGCEFFDFSPNFVQGIHIDGPIQCQKIKFNWAYGGDHKFNFYEINQNCKQRKDYDKVAADNLTHVSLFFDPNEVTIVDSKPIASPSLTCIGQPHNIINGAERLRLFNITVRLKNKRYDPDCGGIDMVEAMEILHDYIIQ